MRRNNTVYFNFHIDLFLSLVKPVIKELKPCRIRTRGGRVILALPEDRAEEFKAWLLLQLEERGFYITDLDEGRGGRPHA